MPIELLPSLPQGHHNWGIVLAGGEGKRLQNFLRTEFGKNSPKQFCSIIGKRSMLKHTIDRAISLIPEKKLMTVICRHHLLHAVEDIVALDPRTVITVPVNRETAPSILLPLMHINKLDPHAVVAIFPSDHFILQEDLFMDHVNAAFECAVKNPEYIITLGVSPSGQQPGYGWIEKGDSIDGGNGKEIFRVKRFREKPDTEQMYQLLKEGCLWNTMTLIGSVSRFLQMYEQCVPELYKNFNQIRNILGTRYETEAIFDLFQTIPSVNFSMTIMEKITHNLAVLPVTNVYWNDWGDENRVRSDMKRFTKYFHQRNGISERHEEKYFANRLESATIDLNTEELQLEEK